MAKKAPPLDLEEETAEREQFNGMLKDEITAAASAIRTQKQKSSEVSGTLSGKLDIFEKKGGHKSALKVAVSVTSMESAECADWMRAFQAYFAALGGNDQIDMFEQANENMLNDESIAVASKVEEPETAAEAFVH